MKKSVWLWQLFGFAFTSLCGTLLHFLYELTDNALWVAPFSGVNESTWEHMKLFFWPAFIYAAAESFFFKERRDFWCIKLRGILLGLVSIPVIFYMYNGVIGKSPDWFNILIFFISAGISYAYELWELKKEESVCTLSWAAIICLCTIGLLFVIFTFATPNLSIFKDPITGAYGV